MNFKANNKNVNLPSYFVQGSISNKFNVDIECVSLKGYAHCFSVDYYAIDKTDALNIYKQFIVKNNLK